MADKKAFLFFDAVQVVNVFQYNELKKINQFYEKKIKPFKSKYLFLEKILYIDLLMDFGKQYLNPLLSPLL